MADATMENPLGPSAQANLLRTVQDIKDCVNELRSDYEELRVPLTEDSQALQRFCVKLEYLLQAGFKSRTGLLGGKKDYWNYFLDCLSSNRTLNDGIRFVKSISEVNTSLGRGRAFLRFALAHQRLADTLQQCVIIKKTTSDWYLPSSIWMQPRLASDLISALYDLNDLQFDLSPRGYELDTGWPTFARKTFGSPGTWRPPSRSTSISSLSSIPSIHAQDSSFLGSSPMPPDAEAEKLRSELSEARASHQAAMDHLENEKLASEARADKVEDRATWAANRADDAEKQLKDSEAERRELQGKCQQLEIECEKLRTELQVKEEAWTKKEEMWSQREEQLQQQLHERPSVASASAAQHEGNEQPVTQREAEQEQQVTQEELQVVLDHLNDLEKQQKAGAQSQAQAKQLQDQKHALEIAEVKVKLVTQQKRNLALQTEMAAVRKELDGKIRVDEKKNELLDLFEKKLGESRERAQNRDAECKKMDTIVRELLEEKKQQSAKLGEAAKLLDSSAKEQQNLADSLVREQKLKKVLEKTVSEQREMLQTLRDKSSQLGKMAKEKVMEKVAQITTLKKKKVPTATLR